ncbi:MAG TPA: ABC transporter substrate-binding protein [Candidatus Acidoferrum sp.]|nr:ABC transporter substrate-binding protein [Candidatus Acidoferrum sp.]
MTVVILKLIQGSSMYVKQAWGILVLLSLIGTVFAAGCMTQSGQNKGTVYETSLKVGDMTEQLKTGNIDGFMIWEPVSSSAILSGTGKVVAYSKDIWPEHPCCILAASTNSLQKLDRNVTLGLVWAHVKGTDFVNDPKNHDKTVQYIAERTGVSTAAANASLKNIRYIYETNASAVKGFYNELKNTSYLNKKVTDIGYSNEDQFFDSFVVQDYVKEVKDNLAKNPNWMPASTNATIKFGALTANSHDIADYAAEKEGYYKEVRLNVVTKQYANGVALMDGFKTGEIDVGSFGLGPAILKRINDNVDITIIAGANVDGSALVMKDNDAIKSLKDLDEKNVAIPGAGTVQDILLRMAAKQNDLHVRVK